MKTICITGVPGSGKTTAAGIFSQYLHNAPSLGVDTMVFNSVASLEELKTNKEHRLFKSVKTLEI